MTHPVLPLWQLTLFGPSKRLHPDRVADLSAHDFTVVCGPLWKGLCHVRVTVLGGIGLPETDALP